MLPIQHSLQQADGYCLPACAQMVLRYLGVSRSQKHLGRQLGVIADWGAPMFHIMKLTSSQLDVLFRADGEIQDVRVWLDQQVPVVAAVQSS